MSGLMRDLIPVRVTDPDELASVRAKDKALTGKELPLSKRQLREQREREMLAGKESVSRSRLPSQPLPAELLYPGSRVLALRAHRETNHGHLYFVPATIVITDPPTDHRGGVLVAYDLPHQSGYGHVFAQVWLHPSRLYPFPDEYDPGSATVAAGSSVYVPLQRPERPDRAGDVGRWQ